jgi:hypothetical protein
MLSVLLGCKHFDLSHLAFGWLLELSGPEPD